jgi:filamentous hemagglutinin family protein
MVLELHRRFPGLGRQVDESMALAIDGETLQDAIWRHSARHRELLIKAKFLEQENVGRDEHGRASRLPRGKVSPLVQRRILQGGAAVGKAFGRFSKFFIPALLPFSVSVRTLGHAVLAASGVLRVVRRLGRSPVLVPALILGGLVPGTGSAQHISVDGRFSPAQTLIGPNYSITASLGRQVSGNLFHSFGQFGLATGENAVFSGPATVSNVIGRVTGGNSSSIDGAIKSNIAGANLYLINPHGVVFGPNATVNVSGSFHVSTADYVKMADGAKFQATNPDGSTLSAAPPVAFGFLNAAPAAIIVNGSRLGPVAGTLGLIGGPVTIAGGALSAPGGTIHIAGAAGPGEIAVDPKGGPPATVTALAPVAVTGGAKLDASGGGSVFIHAGTLTIDASEINADNPGAGSSGQISLRGDTITISGGADIHALALGSGRGADAVLASTGSIVLDNSAVRIGTQATGASGNLSVAAGGTLSLQNGGVLSAATVGNGAAGSILVTAHDLTISPLSAIMNVSSGQLAAGDIAVNVAGQLSIQGRPSPANGNPETLGVSDFCSGCPGAAPETGITSQSSGPANAGNVAINAGKLTITGMGAIGSVAVGSGSGDAGKVSVNVAGQLAIDGGVATIAADQRPLDNCCTAIAQSLDQFRSGILAESMTGKGNSGTVGVSAGTLSLANEGQILSNTYGPARAGDISVNVAGPAVLDNGYIMANSIGGTGNAGRVSVYAPTLTVVDGGAIWTAAVAGFGTGGDISVEVPGQLTVDGGVAGFASIMAWTLANHGGGGLVNVHAGDLSIVGGGLITALICDCASGDAGTTIVNVDRTLKIDGKAQPVYAVGFTTGISSDTSGGSVGNAGSVIVSARDLIILNNGQISSSTTSGSSGNGGNVLVTAGHLTIDASASDPTLVGIVRGSVPPEAPPPSPPTGIVAVTQGVGHAGKISVNAGSLSILNGGTISSSTSGSGKGGDVTVNVGGLLSIDGSNANPLLATGIAAVSSPSTGNAGSLEVGAGGLDILGKGSISTEAATANGGNIAIGVGDLFNLRQGAVTTSVNGALGNGGNIAIDAHNLVLNDGRIVAQAVGGNGGNIMISADEFVPSAISLVSASSELGIAGTVEILGPRVDFNGALVTLPGTLRSPAAILREGCAAQSVQSRSSLLMEAPGRLAQDPDMTLRAFYLGGEERPPAAVITASSKGAGPSLASGLHFASRCE